MERYQEILEKHGIDSLEKFNRLFESKDPLDRYVAFIQKDFYGDIIDVYTLDEVADEIEHEIEMGGKWILPVKESVEFRKFYPVQKNFCVDKNRGDTLYNFLKENNALS